MQVPIELRKLRTRFQKVARDPVKLHKFLDALSEAELELVKYTGYVGLRDDQLIDARDGFVDSGIIFCKCGRGWGKSHVGASYVQLVVEYILPGTVGDICIVAPTKADVNKTIMKAFAKLYPKERMPHYVENKEEIRFHNGTVVHIQSSDQPLRGGNWSFVWCDEVKAWCGELDDEIYDKFDTFKYGVRGNLLGSGDPIILATTTPSPGKLFREWQERAQAEDPYVRMLTGSTLDNPELSDAYKREMLRSKGTAKGRQEIYGEIVTDNPFALWSHADFDRCRVDKCPPLRTIVVAIDPAVSAKEGSDLTGIVVVGIGFDNHGYVLQDSSCKMPADQWAKLAVKLFHRWKADAIVAEVNNGGDLIKLLIKTVNPNIPVKEVRATRNKIIRAEPISNLYKEVEDGNIKPRVHHVKDEAEPDHFLELENQCCNYVPDPRAKSPDRMDALVWGLSYLFFNKTNRTKPNFGNLPDFF